MKLIFTLLALNLLQLNESKKAKVKREFKVGVEPPNKLWILDNVLGKKELCSLKKYYHPITTVQPSTKINFEAWNDKCYGNAKFYQDLDMKTVRKFNFIKIIKNNIEQLLEFNVEFNKARIEYIRMGDQLPISRRFYENSNNSYVFSIFLEDTWRMNSYGEASFYHEQQVVESSNQKASRLELAQSVTPKALRGILWPSHLHVLFRPPCVNHFQTMQLLHLWVSPKEGDYKRLIPSDIKTDEPYQRFSSFPNFQIQTTSKSPKRTHQFFENKDNHKRHIDVYDNIFDEKELSSIFKHLQKNSNFGHSGHDMAPLEDHDNVQWISMFKVEDFVRTSLWKRYQEFFFQMSNETDWYPYDIALNVLTHADSPRIHPDSDKHEVEYTAILYLNKFSGTSCSSIIFHKQSKNNKSLLKNLEGGESFDVVASVYPKYGRLVGFVNNIEHSAQPPCDPKEVRYSFVVKVARNERLALIKMIYETAESLTHTNFYKQHKNLIQELHTTKHYDETQSSISNKQLKEILKQARLISVNSVVKNKINMFKSLTS